MRSFIVLAIVTLFLAVAAPAHAVWKQVRGTLRYADYEEDTTTFLRYRPIPYVTVTLKTGSQLLGTVTTSSTGEFATSVDPAVLNQGPITIELSSQNYASDVWLDLDWVNDRLLWKATFPFVVTPEPLDLSATVLRENFSVHFSILDAITEGRLYSNARRDDDDVPTQVDVQYPDADWSNYNGFWDEITLSGFSAYGYGGDDHEHGFDDAAVLHEYGHHLQDHIGFWEGDSSPHEYCSASSFRRSWIEGYPSLFARAVYRSKSPAVVTQSGSYEATPGCATWPTEGWTIASLYDVIDDDSGEAWDRIDGAQSVNGSTLSDYVFKVFDKTEPASIYGFHNGWVSRNLYPDSHVDLDRVLDHHHALQHELADFRIDGASAPATVALGGSFNLAVSLGNAGYGYQDENVRVRAYVIGMSGPVFLVDRTIPAFQGNQALSLPAQLPASLPPGTYNLTVSIDALDRFPESNEANNTFLTSIRVTYVSCPGDCSSPPVVCGGGSCAG